MTSDEDDDEQERARDLLRAGAYQAAPVLALGLVIAGGALVGSGVRLAVAWLLPALALAIAMAATRVLARWGLRARLSLGAAALVATASSLLLMGGVVAASVQHDYVWMRLGGKAGPALDRGVMEALEATLDPTVLRALAVTCGAWVLGQTLAIRGWSRGAQVLAMAGVAIVLYHATKGPEGGVQDAIVAFAPLGPAIMLLAADSVEEELPAAWARWRAWRT